jgi:hypothetical protein
MKPLLHIVAPYPAVACVNRGQILRESKDAEKKGGIVDQKPTFGSGQNPAFRPKSRL